MKFSTQRLIQLLRREFVIHARVFSLLGISLFLITALMMFVSTEEYCHPTNYVNILDVLIIFVIFLSGVILSASIFTEFRSPASRGQYLSLPASHFEKWFSKWLICVPIHLCLSTVVFVISYMIMGSLLHSIWSECRFTPLSLMDLDILFQDLKSYFTIQALCFLFGIVYHKYALIKSLVTSSLLIFLSGILISVIMGKIFGVNSDAALNANISIAKNITYFLAPLLWLASYFKLKKKEL